MSETTATYLESEDGRYGSIFVDGVEFPRNQAVPVDGALAEELTSGSDRLKGHKFEVSKPKTAPKGR